MLGSIVTLKRFVRGLGLPYRSSLTPRQCRRRGQQADPVLKPDSRNPSLVRTWREQIGETVNRYSVEAGEASLPRLL
jgi:hypothetical protein